MDTSLIIAGKLCDAFSYWSAIRRNKALSLLKSTLYFISFPVDFSIEIGGELMWLPIAGTLVILPQNRLFQSMMGDGGSRQGDPGRTHKNTSSRKTPFLVQLSYFRSLFRANARRADSLTYVTTNVCVSIPISIFEV